MRRYFCDGEHEGGAFWECQDCSMALLKEVSELSEICAKQSAALDLLLCTEDDCEVCKEPRKILNTPMEMYD